MLSCFNSSSLSTLVLTTSTCMREFSVFPSLSLSPSLTLIPLADPSCRVQQVTNQSPRSKVGSYGLTTTTAFVSPLFSFSPSLPPSLTNPTTNPSLAKQTTLFFFCFGNELFFVALYVMTAYRHPLGLATLLSHYPSLTTILPASLLKALIQLTWPQVIALLTFPVMATKQIINCVQFWKASKLLVESDQEDRWAKQNAKKE